MTYENFTVTVCPPSIPDTGNLAARGQSPIFLPIVLILSDFPEPATAAEDESSLKSPNALTVAMSSDESKFSENIFSWAYAPAAENIAPTNKL